MKALAALNRGPGGVDKQHGGGAGHLVGVRQHANIGINRHDGATRRLPSDVPRE